MIPDQTVAALEPVGEIVTFGSPDCKEVSWRKGKMPKTGTKLYANTAPCAELQAKITEQAARIKALEDEAADRESFLKTLADTCTEAERIAIERAGRIDVLESECRKLRDALSEAEAFCKRKDITIERQRKGIELAKTALEKSVERDIKQWHNADIEGDDDDKPPEKLGDEVIQEQLKALAAIAELEKGVG